MDAGFRRSGRIVYQPACPHCRACVPIRIPVASFKASKSQRRCWRRNADLIVETSEPRASDEKFALYQRYLTQWHGRDEAEASRRDEFEAFLYDSPVRSVEFTYRTRAGALVAVGIGDLCNKSLSSAYLYHDPAHAKRGLGTYGALYEIAFAARMGIAHYYVGYWVAGCHSMAYKSTYRPFELLDADGHWRSSADHLESDSLR
jgi:arginine-tRNA-protein transferase